MPESSELLDEVRAAAQSAAITAAAYDRTQERLRDALRAAYQDGYVIEKLMRVTGLNAHQVRQSIGFVGRADA